MFGDGRGASKRGERRGEMIEKSGEWGFGEGSSPSPTSQI